LIIILIIINFIGLADYCFFVEGLISLKIESKRKVDFLSDIQVDPSGEVIIKANHKFNLISAYEINYLSSPLQAQLSCPCI
jgi:hypothetical protein